jgi:hypothetical protein
MNAAVGRYARLDGNWHGGFDIVGCDANPASSSTSCEREGEARRTRRRQPPNRHRDLCPAEQASCKLGSQRRGSVRRLNRKAE